MVKRAVLFCLALALLFAPLCAHSEICLRVVARDDSKEAQMEKLRVRDTVLRLLPKDEERLFLVWSLIEKAAKEQADCTLSLRFYTPPKEKTPRLTVYITIGRGEGQNWFGVLFDEVLLLCSEKTEEETLALYFPLISFFLSLFSGAPASPAAWSGG